MVIGHEADHQRADGPVKPGPVATVQHEAADPAGSVHTAPLDTLLVNQPWIRQSGDSGRPHRHTKLPQRVTETPGQSADGCGRDGRSSVRTDGRHIVVNA